MRSAGQFAQVRGLGYDQTLVLVDGRRTLPSAMSVQWNAFDLNTVPFAAIERIEVLAASASAVYGSDAIGGVVNIITKKNIHDTTLDFDYGTATGGGEEQRAALMSGYSNDRLRSSLVLEYFQRDKLLGKERDRLNDQDFRRLGGRDYRSTTTNPGNVRSLTSANLPGLPDSIAAVPIGSSGVGLTPNDFLATTGQQHKDSLFRYLSILPQVDRRGATASLELDVAAHLTAFADVLYLHRTTLTQYQPQQLTGAIVPANNPFNPFGVPVAVDYLFDTVGPRLWEEHSEMSRIVAGLRGTSGAWDWELSVLRSDDKGSAQAENEVDVNRVAAALAATDPTQALNVFEDGPGASPSLLKSLLAEERTQRNSSTGTHASAILRGPLFELPAGRVEIVAGGEWRAESTRYDRPNAFGVPGSTLVNGERDIAAVFTELRLPLVAHAMHIPAIDDLSFTLAARYDRYGDFGGAFNPQFGLLWQPTPDLMFRASYGTSFEAPSAFDLFFPRTTTSIQISDPLRNGQTARPTVVTGGNHNLDPSTARSATAGILMTPAALPSLHAAVSYWQISIEQLVNIPPALLLAATDPEDSERIVRAERTAADIAAGLPGVLTYLDLTRMNIGSLRTSGVDLALDYSFDTFVGRFVPSVSASWTNEYETILFPGERPVERVGVANFNGTIPRWRIAASLEWSRRDLSLSTTVRHTPHYWDTNEFGQVIDRRVQSQTLLDAQASFKFDTVFGTHPSWSGLKVTVGVSNLFDREPSFAQVLGAWGHDPSQGDLRQRFSYIKLTQSF